MLEILFSRLTKRFLKKSNKLIYNRLIKKIETLSINPFPSDVKRVEGEKDKFFRVRVEDYRILYEIDYEKKIILIERIDKRSRVY
ncbi:MAG: type II toxin-antitoxin system RelE/ParE family toxin [archaeon]